MTEGLALRYREGVGFEWRCRISPSKRLSGTTTVRSRSPAGASPCVGRRPTTGRFRGEAEKFAADTPLRAVLNGITADLVGVGVDIRLARIAVARPWRAMVRLLRRQRPASRDLDLRAEGRGHSALRLTVRPELYTSRNTSNDVPYFSPLRDLSGCRSRCDAEHVLWRRYERSFGHRLVVTGGAYWQEDFGTGWIGSVLYEQVYQYNPRVELRYGVQLKRAIYDGERDAVARGLHPPQPALLMLRRVLFLLLVHLRARHAGARGRALRQRGFSRCRRFPRRPG